MSKSGAVVGGERINLGATTARSDTAACGGSRWYPQRRGGRGGLLEGGEVSAGPPGGVRLSRADHRSKQPRAGSTSAHQSGVAQHQRIAAGITVIAPQDGTTAKIGHLCLLPDARCHHGPPSASASASTAPRAAGSGAHHSGAATSWCTPARARSGAWRIVAPSPKDCVRPKLQASSPKG